MPRAVFDGVVVADSDDVKVVDGLTYFPVADVDVDRLTESSTTTRCPWKGKANYFDVQGESEVAADGAIMYRRPWPLAKRLVTDRIAFWKEVDVIEDP